MTNKLDNLAGETFGFLSVVERAPNDVYGNIWWRCRCICGETKLVRAGQLRSGKFFTCGKVECRFWSKVHVPEDPDACWEWTGAIHSGGYGVFKKPGEKKVLRAHVFSWELHNNELPKKRWVLHKCDNRRCVRPDHLYLGTHEDNMEDMRRRGRSNTSRRKINPELRQKLRGEYRAGSTSQDRLSAKYNVVPRTVRRILSEPDLN